MSPVDPESSCSAVSRAEKPGDSGVSFFTMKGRVDPWPPHHGGESARAQVSSLHPQAQALPHAPSPGRPTGQWSLCSPLPC